MKILRPYIPIVIAYIVCVAMVRVETGSLAFLGVRVGISWLRDPVLGVFLGVLGVFALSFAYDSRQERGWKFVESLLRYASVAILLCGVCVMPGFRPARWYFFRAAPWAPGLPLFCIPALLAVLQVAGVIIAKLVLAAIVDWNGRRRHGPPP